MYKYFVDYLGGETETDKSDSKTRILERIKERLAIKPYLKARLKTATGSSEKSKQYHDYRVIAKYEYVYNPRTKKHTFEEID